jgi:DNA-binding response OmpR family regulator
MEILIVNRDEDLIVILAAYLRREGYGVRVLADPQRVVQEVRGCSLVITDYPTFVAGGTTVTALLRANAETRHVKILNATTRATWTKVVDAATAGVDVTILLSECFDEFLWAVRHILGA